jgi:hypothetical protein
MTAEGKPNLTTAQERTEAFSRCVHFISGRYLKLCCQKGLKCTQDDIQECFLNCWKMFRKWDSSITKPTTYLHNAVTYALLARLDRMKSRHEEYLTIKGEVMHDPNGEYWFGMWPDHRPVIDRPEIDEEMAKVRNAATEREMEYLDWWFNQRYEFGDDKNTPLAPPPAWVPAKKYAHYYSDLKRKIVEKIRRRLKLSA